MTELLDHDASEAVDLDFLEEDEPVAPPAAEGLGGELIARLDKTIDGLWAKARRGAFWRHVVEGGNFDLELYRIVMTQIYHYTRHNSVNQAATALVADPDATGVLRFVYTHAREELGHEKMVLHDLRAVGLLAKGQPLTDPPLPATEALVNYLYGVAVRRGPIARLGYSYWAESVYTHIAPVLLQVRRSLNLSDRDMAFFVAHSEIDSKHAVEVANMIRKAVRTPEQAEAVHQVAETTLALTIWLMEQSYEQWASQ
jgi:pyrroloquinoline quinone (PQQ) biosynthesis protein C